MAKERKFAVVYMNCSASGELSMDTFENKADQSRFYNEQTKNGNLAWKVKIEECNREQVLSDNK